MKTTAKLLAAGIMVFLFTGLTSMSYFNYQQDGKKKPWVVPEKSKALKNPVKSDDANLVSGKTLYNKHCKSCHGAKGLGDGTKAKELDTPSGDFSVKEFQSQTDGEIFYKTKEGRDDMPSFKKKITDDDEIWSVVNYLRTFKEEAKKK